MRMGIYGKCSKCGENLERKCFDTFEEAYKYFGEVVKNE